MKPFILLRPATLSEAAREAARPGSEVKAGGVDLLDRMKEGFDSPQRVVSIAHVPGLDVISAGPPAKIGALATLARIASSSDIKRLYPALAAAAEGAATPQIRNMATLGGNLCQRPRCWYYRLAEFDCRKKGGPTCYAQDGENRFHAIFDSDLFCCCIHASATAVALLAYGAKLNTVSPRGRRTIVLDDFFVRPTEDARRENVLTPGEIIETITIPAPPPGGRSVYKKLKEKESFAARRPVRRPPRRPRRRPSRTQSPWPRTPTKCAWQESRSSVLCAKPSLDLCHSEVAEWRYGLCHPERSEGSALVRISRFDWSRFFVAGPVPTLNGSSVAMTKADSSLRSE